MTNIYELRRYGKAVFLFSTAVVVALFLYFSSRLIADLEIQERQRMEIWAGATRELVASTLTDSPGTDIDFLLSIIQQNTTIPVLLTDSDGNILDQRNFKLPDPLDSTSDRNSNFLEKKLNSLRNSTRCIEINIAPGVTQFLYYEDSTLLRRMSVFPYVQLLVMLAFIAVVYFAVLSTKKAEQNKVWVGLSKETAHQLGTPISSLMAWMELLPDMGVDADTIAELNKDINRLSTIASRFSKIGSIPKMERADISQILDNAADYMKTRISSHIELTFENRTGGPVDILACTPLLEWVVENLIKNAVDAMNGEGKISVALLPGSSEMAIVEVSDTGKGISRKNWQTVFNPGYTTKSRGWGLGLTLAKRIIEQYHRGRICVARSTPGIGTTFRIDLPKAKSDVK